MAISVAVEAVLEGEPHPQVAGQARGGDDLGGSDRLAVPWCLLRHRTKGTSGRGGMRWTPTCTQHHRTAP